MGHQHGEPGSPGVADAAAAAICKGEKEHVRTRPAPPRRHACQGRVGGARTRLVKGGKGG